MSAIAPSSRSLARAMAAHLHPGVGHVVEFGPGTGRITDAILARGVPPQNLTLFELDPEMANHLHARLPQGVTLHRLPAQEAPNLLTTPVDSVISGLPLLSMPTELRLSIFASAFRILAPGGCFVQFTYGRRSPLTIGQAEMMGVSIEKGQMVLGNLPPARVYSYRMTGARHGDAA